MLLLLFVVMKQQTKEITMKKVIYLSLFLICLFSTTAQAKNTSYKHWWQQIEKYDQKDLPKSALRITEQIRIKARQEHNSDQWLAASLRRMHYRYTISKDSFYVDIAALEAEAKQVKTPIEKAFLHLFLGDMYTTYYRQNRYKISKRIFLKDTMDDVRLFGQEQFLQKIKEHLSLALKEENRLHAVSTVAYPMLIKQSSLANYYGHDMYHFMAIYIIQLFQELDNGIDLTYDQFEYSDDLVDDRAFLLNPLKLSSKYDFKAEGLRLFQKLLRYYVTTKNDDAYLLTELSRLSTLNSGKHDAHWASLTTRFSKSEVIVEVYAKMISSLLEQKKVKKAMDLVLLCLDKYKDYERISMIENLEKVITQPSFSLKIAPIKPKQPLKMTLKYKDMEQAMVEVLRVKLPGSAKELKLFSDVKERKRFLRKHATSFWKKKWLLRPTPTHEFIESKLDYPGLNPGVYVVRVSSRTKKTPTVERLIYVSGLKLIEFSYRADAPLYVVVNAESGQPIEDAQVLFRFKNQEDVVLKTNAKGEVKLSSGQKPMGVFASTKYDEGMQLLVSGRRYGRQFLNNVASYHERMYTDRSLYRPGQVVHVAGWCFKGEFDASRVVPHKEIVVKLYDANNKLVAEKKTVSNAYGSYALDFTLPKKGLLGRYLLRSTEGVTYFRVEEYKRPTFRVELFPPTAKYAYGDSLTLKGKAMRYSGVPVQHAAVHISGETTSYWEDDQGQTWELSQITTDEKGQFEVRMYLAPRPKEDVRRFWSRFLSASAVVTDASGETQEGKIQLPLEGASISLSMDIEDVVCKEKLEQKLIKAVNLSRMPQQAKGEYKIYSLLGKVETNRLGKQNTYEQNTLNEVLKRAGNCLLTQRFEANKPLDMTMWKTLPSGAYRMIIKAKDEAGEEAWVAYDFVFYSLKDKHVPIDASNWFQVPSREFDEAHPALVVLGSKEKDVFVYYQMSSNGRCIEQTYLKLSSEVKKISIPYKKEYGPNVEVNFVFVKHGEVYKNNAGLVYIQKDKKQTLTWTSFRDALRPGKKETWELQIQSPKGTPADAEMLATLYDASLDQIYTHDWSFNPPIRWSSSYLFLKWNRIYGTQFSVDKKLSLKANRGLFHDLFYALGDVSYDFLSRRFYADYLASTYAMESDGYEVEQALMGATPGIRIRGASFAKGMVQDDAGIEINIEEAQEKASATYPAMRSNFSETAFFYPQLKTDEEGKVRFTFTLPDALTTWKFMAMSHNKNMDYGKLVAHIKAKKDFMVAPHVPRFVREGDKVVLTSAVINLSTRMLKGKIALEIFNPETDEVVLKKQKRFKVKEGATIPVDFTFRLKGDISLLAFRVKGTSGNYSDGEQHYLPVLSRKQWVTEGVPLLMTKAGKKSYDLSQLFNHSSSTATQRKLSLELTSHPFWTAVQALPALSQPTYANAISLSAAYYANKMSAAIVKLHPRIAQVIRSWKLKGEAASPLELKEDLKQMLLIETPWVQEAEIESTVRQLQTMLLEENIMQERNRSLLKQLKELQSSTGAFGWFKGMLPSSYMTMEVARVLTRLSSIKGIVLDREAEKLLKKAQHYLSYDVMYSWYKKAQNEEQLALSFSQKELMLSYLYMMTMRKQDKLESRLVQYFLNEQLPAIKAYTIYGKSVMALLLHRMGMKGAEDMLASVREYAVSAPDKGSYFDTEDQSESRQYSIPRQVAVIEAASALGQDKWVKELLLWLLQQKQVQQWSSPLATVNAVYALTTFMPISDENRTAEVSYGNDHLRAKDDALGTINKVWRKKEIPSLRTPLVLSQSKDGLIYGVVYAQYLEEVNKMNSTEGALSVRNQYYKVTYHSGKEELTPLDKHTVLHKGDKLLVRLVLKCDRDFDFLQLKVDKAACLEATDVLSGYRYQQGGGYYCAVRDASMNYFFDYLDKGVHTIEQTYYVVREGEYETGLSTFQSAYAPTFVSYSPSRRLNVK